MTPAVEAQSLKHSTAREIPQFLVLDEGLLKASSSEISL